MSRLLSYWMWWSCTGGNPEDAVRTARYLQRSCIASRTKSKCDDLKAKLEGKTSTKIDDSKG